MITRIVALGLLMLLASADARSQTVYVNDFETGDVAGWTTTVLDPAYQRVVTITDAPNASTRYLGDFGNQSVTFITSGLPLHDSIIVELNLYVIRTWDGNASDDNGPDIFSVADGTRGTIMRTTFANDISLLQAYPDAYVGGANPGRSGAVAADALGYDNGGDAAYRLRIAYPHTGRDLILTLAATLRDRFPTLANESWGIDNISISVTEPKPASATLTIGSAIGAPGERIFIPIHVRDAISVLASGATSIRARLRFNGSMLMPETPTPRGTMEGRDRVIDLDLPLEIAADSTIAIFNFRVKVGDDTVTAITLEAMSAVDGEIALTSRAGTFRVRGLCYDGGTRLFRSDAATLLRPAAPNPARDRTTIAFSVAGRERTRIDLLDAEGRVARVLMDGFSSGGEETLTFDVADLATGRYVVRLTAGHQQIDGVLHVIR